MTVCAQAFRTSAWARSPVSSAPASIGMALDTALNLFQWYRVAMVPFAILAVVMVAEIAVTYIRKHVI